MRYEKIKFLVIALKNAVEVYAWAPKPYHKFMAFKVGTSKGPHFWKEGLTYLSIYSFTGQARSAA